MEITKNIRSRSKLLMTTLCLACVVGLFAAAPAFSVIYNCPANGHSYEFIPTANTFSWTAARDAAAAAGGYLATITSAAEQTCLENAPQNSGAYWAGGSDVVSEGVWLWKTGPEAGTQFWDGGPPAIGGQTTAPDFYANWFPPPVYYEPNNSGNEDYLSWNISSESAHWNDVGHTNSAIRGYVIEYEPVPPPTINDILIYFDESVSDEILFGNGPGNSADGRLYALRNMLEMAGDLIGFGDTEGACDQLDAASRKCDGDSPPPDFAAGSAALELYDMILELMAELGCE